MATQDELLKARQIVSRLPDDQRKAFTEKFSGLDQTGKVMAVRRLIAADASSQNQGGQGPARNVFGEPISNKDILGREFGRGERSAVGNVFERPGAAVRGGIQSFAAGKGFSEGFQKGSAVPEEVPSFQDLFIKKAQFTESPALNAVLGTPASAAGLVLDFATNPADALAAVATGGLSKAASGTKAGQAIKTALTKQRKVPKILDPQRNFISSFKSVSTRKGQTKLAGKARDAFFNSKREAGEVFAKQLDDLVAANPDKRVSIRSAIENMKFELTDTGSQTINKDFLRIERLIKSAERKSGNKLLSSIIDDPRLADSLTLKQTKEIQKTLKSVPGFKQKLAQGKFANWQESDIGILDFLDDIKSNQLDVFPELSKVNADYKAVLDDYKLVKNMFKKGKLIKNIKNNFGGDPEVLDAVEQLLDPEVMQALGGFRKVSNFLDFGKTGIGVAALSEIARRTFSRPTRL